MDFAIVTYERTGSMSRKSQDEKKEALKQQRKTAMIAIGKILFGESHIGRIFDNLSKMLEWPKSRLQQATWGNSHLKNRTNDWVTPLQEAVSQRIANEKDSNTREILSSISESIDWSCFEKPDQEEKVNSTNRASAADAGSVQSAASSKGALSTNRRAQPAVGQGGAIGELLAALGGSQGTVMVVKDVFGTSAIMTGGPGSEIVVSTDEDGSMNIRTQSKK